MEKSSVPDLNLLVCRRFLAERLGVSPRHLSRLLAAGKMPRPVRLGAAVRWRRDDIERWLELGCCDQEHFEGGPK